MHGRKAAEGVSRRGFLGALGAAGALAPGVCMMGVGAAAHAQTVTTTLREDRFGRIFQLPPFATPSTQLTAALTELEAPFRTLGDIVAPSLTTALCAPLRFALVRRIEVVVAPRREEAPS